MHHNRHGFTLIEMLAVIAIIGLLAALLLNVVHSTRQRAKMNNCKVNLSTFSREIDMYRINWDRDYPFYLSNLVPTLAAVAGTPDHFICPSDWSGGEDGGVPDTIKGSGDPFMSGDKQFSETDDTEFNTLSNSDGKPYQVFRNQAVTRCSYLYEFCGADCSWDNPQHRPWYVVKEEQIKSGAQNDAGAVKYAGGHVPAVRCFWHIKQKDEDRYEDAKRVLNVGIGDRDVFLSTAKWENDL
jgi:prepilin-type N-terminal cleavage/methylation domain-containing protein